MCPKIRPRLTKGCIFDRKDLNMALIKYDLCHVVKISLKLKEELEKNLTRFTKGCNSNRKGFNHTGLPRSGKNI